MATVSFEDFYEVPDLNFDIARLRKDLDNMELLKTSEEINRNIKKKLNSLKEELSFDFYKHYLNQMQFQLKTLL